MALIISVEQARHLLVTESQCGWIDDEGALHGQAKAPTAGQEAYGLWAKVVQISSEVLPCHMKLTGH